MHPERPSHPWGLLLRAVLVGAALGVVAFAAGSLILYEAGGVLAATAGLVATFAAALAAGLWAGAPAAHADRPPLVRWIFAGVAVGVAGVFATAWTLLGGDRYGELARALALLVLVGFPVYACGLLLPALVAWEGGEEGDEDGPAGFAAAGTAAVAVLAGLAVGAAVTGLFLLPGLSPGPLLLGMGAALTFPLAFPRGRGGADDPEEVLYEAETPYGTVRVTEIVFPGQRQPERRLYQNEEIESGELVRSGAPSFAYIAAAERVLADLARPGERYLFLGGGAYTLPRRVAERDPRARITVVELDPEVTRVAYRYFGLRPEHGVSHVHGDARRVAESLPAAEWDRLFVDVYDGSEAVPQHLVTVEALSRLRALLAPGGVLVMNVIGVAKGEGERRFWSTVRTAAEAFPAVALYYHLGRDFPERQNFLLVASPDPAFVLQERAGAFERWPQGDWRLEGTTVFRDRVPAHGEEALPPAADPSPAPDASPHRRQVQA